MTRDQRATGLALLYIALAGAACALIANLLQRLYRRMCAAPELPDEVTLAANTLPAASDTAEEGPEVVRAAGDRASAERAFNENVKTWSMRRALHDLAEL